MRHLRLTIMTDAPGESTPLVTFTTDPAGPNPYLLPTMKLGGQTVNFVNGDAKLGSLLLSLVDVPRIDGDQDSGAVSYWMFDATGHNVWNARRAVVERQDLAGVYSEVVFDGVIDSPEPGTGVDLLTIQVSLTDIRERETTTRMFSKVEQDLAHPDRGPCGTTLLPHGVVRAYSDLVPAAVPLSGVFWGDPRQGAAVAGRVKLDATLADLNLVPDWFATLQSYGGLQDVVDISTGQVTGRAFGRIRVRWRPKGSGGAWTILDDMPAVANTEYETSNVFGNSPDEAKASAAITGMKIAGNARINALVVLTSTGAGSLPAHKQAVEILVEAKGPPTDAVPCYIAGTLGQFAQDAYDGLFSDYPPGLRYDAAAMTAFVTGTPAGRAIITAPEDEIRKWLAENSYKPTGFAPVVNKAGRIAPLRYSLPDEDAVLLQLTNDNCDNDPSSASWKQTKDSIVNSVTFTYKREYLAAEAWPGQPAVERLQVEDVPFQYLNVASAALASTKDTSYSPVTVRTGIDAAVRTLPGRVSVNTEGVQLALGRVADVKDRFPFGDLRIRLWALRSDAGVAAAAVGDWAQVGLSWLPDPTTRRRGLNRLMQIVDVQENDAIWREFELSDAGPLAVPCMQPTVGALVAHPDLTVDVPITGNVPAGGFAAVEYAIADVEPDSTSGLWLSAGRLAAPGTITLPAAEDGDTVWVRVRGEKQGTRRSVWTDALSAVIGASLSLRKVRVYVDAEGRVFVAWTGGQATAAVRVSWDVRVPDPTLEAAGPFAAHADFAVAEGSPGVYLPGVVVASGEQITALLTPYDGWTGAAATGTAGTSTPSIRATLTDDFGTVDSAFRFVVVEDQVAGTAVVTLVTRSDVTPRVDQVRFLGLQGGVWDATPTDLAAPPFAVTVPLGTTVRAEVTGTTVDGLAGQRLFTEDLAVLAGTRPVVEDVEPRMSAGGVLDVYYEGDSDSYQAFALYRPWVGGAPLAPSTGDVLALGIPGPVGFARGTIRGVGDLAGGRIQPGSKGTVYVVVVSRDYVAADPVAATTSTPVGGDVSYLGVGATPLPTPTFRNVQAYSDRVELDVIFDDAMSTVTLYALKFPVNPAGGSPVNAAGAPMPPSIETRAAEPLNWWSRSEATVDAGGVRYVRASVPIPKPGGFAILSAVGEDALNQREGVAQSILLQAAAAGAVVKPDVPAVAPAGVGETATSLDFTVTPAASGVAIASLRLYVVGESSPRRTLAAANGVAQTVTVGTGAAGDPYLTPGQATSVYARTATAAGVLSDPSGPATDTTAASGGGGTSGAAVPQPTNLAVSYDRSYSRVTGTVTPAATTPAGVTWVAQVSDGAGGWLDDPDAFTSGVSFDSRHYDRQAADYQVSYRVVGRLAGWTESAPSVVRQVIIPSFKNPDGTQAPV